MTTRSLFGGALTTSLPADIVDASDLRQVPDTQEVLVFNDSDLSVIFEILQMVQEGQAAEDLREAAKFHFSSIAHDNTALASTVDSISSPFPLPSSSGTAKATSTQTSASQSKLHLYATLEGTQVVSKFNLPASEADLVKIFLAVVRVDLGEPSRADPSQPRGADIAIAVNVPLGKAKEAETGNLPQAVKDLEVRAKQIFQQAVQDLKIVDYDLFA